MLGTTDSEGRFAFTAWIGQTVIFEHKNMTPTCKFIDPSFESNQELEVSAFKLIDEVQTSFKSDKAVRLLDDRLILTFNKNT